MGLLYGIVTCLELGIRKLQVLGDSQLVINIMTSLFKARDPNIVRYYRASKDFSLLFDEIKFFHIPREMNTKADKLARQKREKFMEYVISKRLR